MEVEISEQIKFLYATYGFPKEDIPVQVPNKRLWDFVKGLAWKEERYLEELARQRKQKSNDVARRFPVIQCDNVTPEQLQQLRYFLEMFFWRTRTMQINYGKTKTSALTLVTSSTQRFINHYNEFIKELDGMFLVFYGQVCHEVLAIRDIPHLLSLVKEAMKYKLFDKRDKPHVKLFLRLNVACVMPNLLRKSGRFIERKYTNAGVINSDCVS